MILEYPIYNDFFDICEIIKISKLNHEHYEFVKEYIRKINNIIKKIHSLSFNSYNYTNYHTITNFSETYWKSLFNKDLNSSELAIYYSYIFSSYHLQSARQLFYETKKCYLCYPNGMLKSLPDQKNFLTLNYDEDKNNIILEIILKYYYDNDIIKYQDVIISYYRTFSHNIINIKSFEININNIKKILLKSSDHDTWSNLFNI